MNTLCICRTTCYGLTRQRSSHLRPPRPRHIHTTTPRRADVVDHYEILGVKPDASQGDIKKQFYSLSKTHHPDLNPSDPNASERFVKISTAYAVLGSPEKRDRYDRDTFRAGSSSSSQQAAGASYSSASASSPFGARPASGLSRRRTTFKGPPPSFYRSGGWGSHAARRGAQAEATAQSAREAADQYNRQEKEAQGPTQSANGMGPGQGHAWFGGEVPHWDQQGHQRTQEQWDKRRGDRRKREEEEGYVDTGSGNFATGLAVCMCIAVGSGTWWARPSSWEQSRIPRKQQ